MAEPKYDPNFHYENIAITLSQDGGAKSPLLDLWLLNGVAEDILDSQYDKLNNPGFTFEDQEALYGEEAALGRYWDNRAVAKREFLQKKDYFLQSKEKFNFAAHYLYDKVSDTYKMDIFKARHIDIDTNVLNKTKMFDILNVDIVQKYMNENHNAWHLLEDGTERQAFYPLMQKMASYYLTNPDAFTPWQAVEKAVTGAFNWAIVGKDHDSGVYSGVPTKLGKAYGLTSDQVANGARRFLVEKILMSNYDNIEFMSKEQFTAEQIKMLFEAAQTGRGTMQFSAVTKPDGWHLGLREHVEKETWGFNEWAPTKTTGFVYRDGKPITVGWDDAIRMSLSDEIVSGLQQMYQMPDFGMNLESPIWENLLEFEKEYIDSDNNIASKRHLSPQQWGKGDTDFAGRFPFLRFLESYSKAQVDYVIKPMLKYFRDKAHPDHPFNPPDSVLREYINKELKKHGEWTNAANEYFSGYMKNREFLFKALNIVEGDPDKIINPDPLSEPYMFRVSKSFESIHVPQR